MGLEWFDSLDDFESWSLSIEQSEEEKKKASESSAGQKRVKADESKAKKHDDKMYKYLVQILKDRSYDKIVDDVISALYSWVPSFYILWTLSLVYMPISDDVRSESWNPRVEFTYNAEDVVDFSSVDLDVRIKNRLQDLVFDMTLLAKSEQSYVMANRFMNTWWEEKVKVFKVVLSYFFTSLKVNFTDSQLISYSSYIIWLIENELKSLDFTEV